MDFEGFSVNELVHGIRDISESLNRESAPRRSERVTKGIPPVRFNEHLDNEPRTYTEALQCPENVVWQAAIKEEINSLAENQT